MHVKQYITTHGVSLNCNTDLSWYDHIVPCGIEGKGATSLSNELNTDVKVSDVLEHFCDAFKEEFDCDITYDDKQL